MNPDAPGDASFSLRSLCRGFASIVLLRLAASTFAASAAAPVSIAFKFPDPAAAADWKPWSPRDEISPQFSFDPAGGRNGGGALKLAARLPSDFGAWRRQIPNLRGGTTYRFAAWYRASGVENERRSVIARLQWLDAQDKPVKASAQPPEYPLDVAHEAGWARMETILRAPEVAAGLDVQLSLGFAPGGSVSWDEVSLTEVPATPGRIIRAMTVHHRPRNSKSAAANVEEFYALVRQAAAQKPDIVCLPEGITVVSTGKSYPEVGETIPGPTTQRLGALAKELRTYVVAGIYERVAPAVYNTAVLIDRDGRVAGTYRKTHLPREEWEGGLTPGDSYPVFDTDFGRVAVLVCWDLQFPEPWRAVALQGAELVLLPIWGGDERLLPARAIENHAFIVSSSYSMKSCVVDPVGNMLAEATAASPVATAELHLDEKIYQPWIGNMKTRTWKERRGDLPWITPEPRPPAVAQPISQR
ncbi:MAG: carbon-nitrogen hydrolase family protein [Opitutaceae bacterium]|nr:carbon-nitrogen hydrolase family protein [Opitutaceae bacterium]